MGDVSLVGLSGVVMPSNNRSMSQFDCSGVFWTCHCFLNVNPTQAYAVIRFWDTFDREVGKGTLLFGTLMDYDAVT